jgi:hypothetical protein
MTFTMMHENYKTTFMLTGNLMTASRLVQGKMVRIEGKVLDLSGLDRKATMLTSLDDSDFKLFAGIQKDTAEVSND